MQDTPSPRRRTRQQRRARTPRTPGEDPMNPPNQPPVQPAAQPDAQPPLAVVLQQLAQAIAGAQAQAQAQQQQQNAQQGQPQVLQGANVSPYEGHAIDLSSKTGQTIFFEGSKSLPTKYSGKPDQAYIFLGDLKERARTCCWDKPLAEHGILTVIQDGVSLNVLEAYGQITEATMTAAVTAREAANDTRAKQNSRMMHACIYSSIIEDAKSSIISSGVPEDGPFLFYKVMKESFTATFTHAQATRILLMNLQPKKYSYDVLKVNEQVRISLDAIKVASAQGQGVNNQEALFILFEIYKRIKVPRSWVAHISYLESRAGMETDYKYSALMNEAARKYQELRDKNEWKASDKAPDEQILALIANIKTGTSNKSSSRGKSGSAKTDVNKNTDNQPPFLYDEDGKIGDQKEWNDKIYYRCDGPHKSKWTRHKPGECKKGSGGTKSVQSLKDKGKRSSGNKVVVDRSKLKRMMVAMAECETSDPDQQADLMMSALELDIDNEDQTENQSVESNEDASDSDSDTDE